MTQGERSRLGPLIAIVGSDGAGKSTVGDALLAWMRQSRPTELCHLGKQSGNIGRAVARWPLLGAKMGRTIQNGVKTAGSQGPGPVATMLIYVFALRRLLRFRRMLAIRGRGIAVLADRYPQLSVPTGLDGPGFGKVRQQGALVRVLARRELRHFEWMSSHCPDLVIRLNVDAETAIRRKPDHNPSALRAKIANVPQLTFGDARIVDIDASRPLAEVLEHAKREITALMRS